MTADTSSLSLVKPSEIQELLQNLLGILQEQLGRQGTEDKTTLENYIDKIEYALSRINSTRQTSFVDPEDEGNCGNGSLQVIFNSEAFPPVMYEVVEHLAGKMNISPEDVLNRAITLLNFASYAASTGRKVGIVTKDQKVETEIKGI